MRPRRQEDGGNILGTIWCGTLGIILIWLLVITIVFALLIWDAHNRLDDFERRLGRADKAIEENEECCTEITDTVDGFRPCLDEYCAPSNFPRLLDAVICKGCWNANTNFPALTSGVGTNGDLYHVCVNGSTNIEGITDWKVGDALKFIENTPSGPRWIKNDGSPEPIPPPPDIVVTLENVGVAPGVENQDFGATAQSIVNPGTVDSFGVKSMYGARGIWVYNDGNQIGIQLRLSWKSQSLNINYTDDQFPSQSVANHVKPNNEGEDFVPGRIQYHEVFQNCDLPTDYALRCGCFVTHSNTQFGTRLYRTTVLAETTQQASEFFQLPGNGIFAQFSPRSFCRCEHAMIAGLVDDEGKKLGSEKWTIMKFRVSALCAEGDPP